MKNVNDDLGHAAGDDVLRAAAQHLRGALRPGGVLARLGGDEFVASLVTPITDPEISQLTERIHTALAEPILIEGARLRIGASIGVVVADHHDPATPNNYCATPTPPCTPRRTPAAERPTTWQA